MNAFLLIVAVTVFSRPSAAGSCSGVVYWGSKPSWIDCLNPCANSCATFIVSTPLGDGAVCGCSTTGPNGGPEVALVPPGGSGLPAPVGACPNGQPPVIVNKVRKLGPGRLEFSATPECP
jgi:hypothetical protein